MSFQLSFHLAPLNPSGAHWLDDPPDMSCKENTRQYAVDDPLLDWSARARCWRTYGPRRLQRQSEPALATT